MNKLEKWLDSYGFPLFIMFCGLSAVSVMASCSYTLWVQALK